MPKTELLNSQTEGTGMGWLCFLIALGLNKSGMPQIPQLTERHETEPQCKRLIICWASTHRLFRSINWGLWFWEEEEVKNKHYQREAISERRKEPGKTQGKDPDWMNLNPPGPSACSWGPPAGSSFPPSLTGTLLLSSSGVASALQQPKV